MTVLSMFRVCFYDSTGTLSQQEGIGTACPATPNTPMRYSRVGNVSFTRCTACMLNNVAWLFHLILITKHKGNRFRSTDFWEANI